jgi:hypothetical protein
MNKQRPAVKKMKKQERERLIDTIKRLRAPNIAGRDSLEVLRELRGYPPGS